MAVACKKVVAFWDWADECAVSRTIQLQSDLVGLWSIHAMPLKNIMNQSLDGHQNKCYKHLQRTDSHIVHVIFRKSKATFTFNVDRFYKILILIGGDFTIYIARSSR